MCMIYSFHLYSQHSRINWGKFYFRSYSKSRSNRERMRKQQSTLGKVGYDDKECGLAKQEVWVSHGYHVM